MILDWTGSLKCWFQIPAACSYQQSVTASYDAEAQAQIPFTNLYGGFLPSNNPAAQGIRSWGRGA